MAFSNGYIMGTLTLPFFGGFLGFFPTRAPRRSVRCKVRGGQELPLDQVVFHDLRQLAGVQVATLAIASAWGSSVDIYKCIYSILYLYIIYDVYIYIIYSILYV